MSKTIDFLSRILGKQKKQESVAAQTEQDKAFPVADDNLQLYHEAEQFAEAHPEVLDEFGDFDKFALHYAESKKNQTPAIGTARRVLRDLRTGRVLEDETVQLKRSTPDEFFGEPKGKFVVTEKSKPKPVGQKEPEEPVSREPAAEPIEIEKKGVDNKPVTTEAFLDRLTKK